MVRLFLITIARFLIIALATYVGFLIFKSIIRVIYRFTQLSKRYPENQKTPKPKEQYSDVKDAKFVEMPDEEKKDKEE